MGDWATTAVQINDDYQPYVTSQTGGGPGAFEVSSGPNTAQGSGASAATPQGMVWTWSVIATLLVLIYVVFHD